MNVLMVSTSYPENSQDWNGRFIYCLANSLARQKDVIISLWAPPGELPDNTKQAATKNDAIWLRCLSQRGGIAHLLKNRRIFAAGTVLHLLTRLARCYRRQQADVCHVNWLQNALPLLGTRTPALIAVLGSDFGLLRFPGMVCLIRGILRQRRAILAPNAEWMRPELELRFGDLAEIRTIQFGVDDAWFSVVRKLPDDVRCWLAITRLTKKKIGYLFDWGEGLFGINRQLHLFGPMQEQLELPPWVKYHGPTCPDDLLQTWFPCASGLITLSRHDEGMPQVVLEAMAAGLPVIASDLPAHRDIVQHKKNGWLVSNPDDLRQGLDWLDVPSHNLKAGQVAREGIITSIGNWDDCAVRYATAYSQLLESVP